MLASKEDRKDHIRVVGDEGGVFVDHGVTEPAELLHSQYSEDKVARCACAIQAPGPLFPSK